MDYVFYAAGSSDIADFLPALQVLPAPYLKKLDFHTKRGKECPYDYITTLVCNFIEGHFQRKRAKFHPENTPTDFIESMLKVQAESEESEKVISILSPPFISNTISSVSLTSLELLR